MTPAELITALERDGLRLGLDSAGGLRCYGNKPRVGAWLPAIRAHKPALLAALTGVPEPSPTPIFVTCHTPAGTPMRVQARDAEHAAWLARMNPAPNAPQMAAGAIKTRGHQ